MEELYYNAIDLLKKMIDIPSFSREEVRVADLIEDYIRMNGHSPKRVDNNIWIMSPDFDPKKPTILLNSHIDTVKPVAGCQKDPFVATEEEDMLFGLGSNDAGASLVSLMHAFFHLSSTDQSYNLIFLASAEEEVSGKNGVEKALSYLPPISFAIVGEPTGMHPAIAEKGLMVLDCEAKGIAGHAARDEGDNAIYKAVDDINWFRTFQFPKVSDLLGAVKMTVSMIHAGTQHNVVPDSCTYVVDIRSNELYSNQEIFDIVNQHTQSEIKARSFRLNSSRIDSAHPFVQRAKMIGKEAYGSPTLSDQALMSFPSLKMGPGESRRSHTADEYIHKSEIREAIELYIKLLDKLAI